MCELSVRDLKRGVAYLIGRSHTKESLSNYEVSLCRLEDDEMFLDAGRFKNFRFSGQAYQVDFKQTSMFKNWFEECVNWISSNTSSNWSVTLKPHHVSDISVSWSFENKDEALLFKLSTNLAS